MSDGDKRGWIEAWTEYKPSSGFHFDVVRESGTDYIRNKVLRRLLQTEQEMLAGGKPLHAALSQQNYEIEDGGATDGGLQRLLLKPARRADGIVNGTLLLAPSRDSILMQGRLVKSPSFWVRDIDVTWKYASAGDHMVPTELAATGHAWFYGRVYLKMSYEYASIDGQSTNTR